MPNTCPADASAPPAATSASPLAASAPPSSGSAASAPAPPCPSGMIWIPGATFAMGSRAGFGPANEHPQHDVTLGAYCLDRTEVTVGAYRACTREARADVRCPPAPTSASKLGYDPKRYDPFCNGDREDRSEHPINCVTWELARTHCAWAGKRLPTEAEWEYAARRGEPRTYAWGDEPPAQGRLNACGAECWGIGARSGSQWTPLYPERDPFEATAPVGTTAGDVSPLGIMDMGGNVAELVSDFYGLYTADPARDPQGPGKDVFTDAHAVRGGDWATSTRAAARVAHRVAYSLADRDPTVGFRCASTPAPR